jgi:hypothetical protein
MVAVDGCPPEWTALHRREANDGKDKLHWTRRMVRPMAKVAVVKCGHSKHANKIQSNRHAYRHPTPPSPDHANAPHMQKDKWDGTAEFKALGKCAYLIRSVREVVGVNRVDNGGEDFFHV